MMYNCATAYSCMQLFYINLQKHSIMCNFWIVSPSTIVTEPTDTSAAAPFSGVFTCSVEGYGYHIILWYKQFGTLPYKHKIKEITTQGVITSILIIPNVTKEDVGEYYCHVWANQLGVRSIAANLYYSGKSINWNNNNNS